MRRIIAYVGVAALMVSVLAGVSGVASADNWTGATGNTGCSSTLNKADNRDHYFYYGTLTNATQAAANDARTDNINPTDVDTFTTTNLTSTTDVVAYDEYYSTYCLIYWPGAAAFTECGSLNQADECEQHEVRFNLAAIDALGPANDKSLACHEFGHSLGLKHRQVAGSGGDGCMDNDHYYANYTDHDRNHLNNNY